jgi:hypothetical protein
MIDARFRPLPKWNRKPDLRSRQAQFKTPYNRTLDLLESELRHLKAKNIVIEAGYGLDQIRNDGWPRGGTSPSHPGAILYFDSADGALCFPCGTYSRIEHNIHAIALTLENLRAVDRYGVTLGHEQYRGFAALPAPPKQMTVEDAARFIASNSAFSDGVIIENANDYRLAYRQAAARLHPDVTGSNDAFYTLGRAKERLDQHHGLATAGGTL